jgi:outer membrane autotransporter protein
MGAGYAVLLIGPHMAGAAEAAFPRGHGMNSNQTPGRRRGNAASAATQAQGSAGKWQAPRRLRRSSFRGVALLGCSVLALSLGWHERAAGQTVTISGDVYPGPATSPVWTVSGAITFDDGSLVIAGGGRVTSDGGFLAYSPDTTSTVTVTGAGSSWTDTDETMVGIWGHGILTISAGGRVSSNAASLGVFGGGGDVTVTGPGSTWTIAGTLMIAQNGYGTLTITNGGTVSSGAAIVGDGGATGLVTVSGAGSAWAATAIRLGGSGTGILTVADGGRVSVGPTGAGLIDVRSGGTVNIGAAAGSPAVAAGTLVAAELKLADSTLNFNHIDGAYVFAPRITGAGTVEQRSGTTILTADSSAFTGETLVSGGRLVVNGSLGGMLTLGSGGVLGGSGTVSSLTIGTGATVAPGNSIGTLNVTGNVGFAAGSRYQVEIDATGRSDRIVAGGTATLAGGTVDLVKAPGAYLPGLRYTILSATGGVTGTFADFSGFSGTLPFISLGLNYDANNVYFDITRNRASFASVGLTRNQIAAAAAIETLGQGNGLYDAVVQQASAADARAAFDALSGEIHADVKALLIDDSRFVREAATSRLRSAFGAVGAARGPVTTYQAGGPANVAATTERFAVWGEGFGSWGRWSGDGNAGRLDRSTGGFLIGADGLVAETWRLGLLAGYSHAGLQARERRSSAATDNIHLGLYAGTQWGALALRTGAAYTWHDLSTNRLVSFAGFGDQLKAGTKAGTTQLFGEFGYSIALGASPIGTLAVEPFANLAYVSLATGAFAEKGGAAALASRAETEAVTFTTLGLRAATGLTLGTIGATLRGTLGWRHAFGDVVPAASLAFAGGSPFTVAGTPIARDAAVIEAGLDLALSPAASLGLSYGGQLARGVSDHGLKGNFSWRF